MIVVNERHGVQSSIAPMVVHFIEAVTGTGGGIPDTPEDAPAVIPESSTAQLICQGNALGLEVIFSAAGVGFDAASVKELGSVVGNTLDVQGLHDLRIAVGINNTGGGSTGLGKLVVDLFDSQNVNILSAFDLVTAINLKADNTVTIIVGRSNVAFIHYTSGTPVLSENAELLRIPARMRLTFTTTEVSDATTVTATINVRAVT